MEATTMAIDGYGYGSDSGSGYGYGSGYGDGDGYGYGYGDGYGNGYGSGDEGCGGDYLNKILELYPKPNGSVLAFWRSTEDGQPVNGGKGTVAVEGKTESINGPLKICTCQGLHGTLDPRQWKGVNWWVVALYLPVQRQEDKIASLKRTYIKHLGRCPF